MRFRTKLARGMLLYLSNMPSAVLTPWTSVDGSGPVCAVCTCVRRCECLPICAVFLFAVVLSLVLYFALGLRICTHTHEWMHACML
jgi:hypothetical protein